MKYIEIEEYIMRKIKSGDYLADDKIPSENDLVLKFNVSRMTVRKAIENLVARNYLYKVNGKGSFVVNKDERITIHIDEIEGFKNRTIKSGHIPKTVILDFQVKTLNYLTANKMNLNVNDKIFYIERVRYLDGKPVILEITYMPYYLYFNMEKKDIENSKYDYISDKGIKIDSMEKEYFSILPEKRIQDILEIDSNVPLFKTELISYNENQEVLEYTKIYYNQKKYRFIQTIKKIDNL